MSGKKVFDRGANASKERQPFPQHSVMAHGPETAMLLKESFPMNEIERGQRRVNLPPLKVGPFGKGEENNLYEEQSRQRAILETKLPCRGKKDDLFSIFTVRPFLRSQGLYLALKLQLLGGERGHVHTQCYSARAVIHLE